MPEQKVLDHGILQLEDYCASDLAVVNAARVSLNMHSEGMTERDSGLIRFLMRERHGTPFEHGFFRFVVKCPLFVAREWHRHRIGHSYNEWSGRYSEIQPEFYVPASIRTQVGKPGAYSFEPADKRLDALVRNRMTGTYRSAYALYTKFLRDGVAKEQARLVLPVATYTKFYWSCNPRSLMDFLSLRNTDQAMFEIREYAKAAEQVFKVVMPITAMAFIDRRRVKP